MKRICLKILLAASSSALLCTAAMAVSSMAATFTVKNYTPTTEATTIESTTEMTTTEVTTHKSVTGSRSKSKGDKKPTETTETTTEKRTETTTEEPVTFDKAKYEAGIEITTYELKQYSDNPVDKNGNPLTGNALEAYNVVKNTYKDKWRAVTAPEYREEVIYNDADRTVREKSFRFENNDIFSIKRYTFNTASEERYRESIVLPGSQFEMRYVDSDTGEWYMSQNPLNVKKQTLFINTDRGAIVLSVPAVYTNNKFSNNTEEYNPQLEEPVSITIDPNEDTVTIEYSFPNDPDYVGEIWYLLSTEHSLSDWNNINHFNVLDQELAVDRRFSWDGYYFAAPSNYIPYSPTMLYRHPSNYVGASFARYGDFLAAYDLGYVFTYMCMQNQNELGYWATGPKSNWLAEDFNIGAGFYDTRFNTDFATNLINAYKRYNNDDFLMAVCRYAEYYIDHAAQNHYDTKNGGWLVEDYGYEYEHNRTHVSLNHQLAEMNLLYTLYQTTREEKYKEYADKMLLAIEDTRDQWVLGNNNLNYALYYMAGTNPMVDYPYLTYNDLFDAQALHNAIYGKDNDVIAYLMSCKMDWMIKNNVTGYKTE